MFSPSDPIFPSRIGRELRIPLLSFIFVRIHDPQKHDHRRAILEFPIKKNKPGAIYTNLLVQKIFGWEGNREIERVKRNCYYCYIIYMYIYTNN